MPTSFLSADAGFPRLSADVPAEERLNRIENYLYMLLEQLRYALANLGEENFNETSLKEIEGEISGPIMNVVTDLEGNVSTLEQTATQISSTVESQGQSISTVTQKADSIEARIDNVDGEHTSIEVFATGITSTVSSQGQSITTLQQTADGIYADMYNNNGRVASISATADKIGFIVADYETATASTFQLTSRMATLVADEINVQGVVTFQSLDTYLGTSRSTQINGNNILLQSDQTGASGSFLSLVNENSHSYGELWTQPTDRIMDPNAYKNTVMLALQAEGTVDGVDCGLLLESAQNLVVEGRIINLSADKQVVIDAGSDPTLISAYGATYTANTWPLWCYVFCNDGIYYGGRRILST